MRTFVMTATICVAVVMVCMFGFALTVRADASIWRLHDSCRDPVCVTSLLNTLTPEQADGAKVAIMRPDSYVQMRFYVWLKQ